MIESDAEATHLKQGEWYDLSGRYDDAWASWLAAKRLAFPAGAAAYADDAVAAMFSRLATLYASSKFRDRPKMAESYSGRQPIFIVGFPRSGTTLLQQLLSRHRDIVAGDEMAGIPKLVNDKFYPFDMTDEQENRSLRDSYMKSAIEALSGPVFISGKYFIDKQPLNCVHLELLTTLFPRSPILYLERDPRDVLVSLMSVNLTHGQNCGATLETAALHYARVRDLVAHYRICDRDANIRPVRYETLVTDTETELRSIFNFLKLKYDSYCLRPTAHGFLSKTPSAWQARLAPYSTSIGRWKNYAKYLEPVKDLVSDSNGS